MSQKQNYSDDSEHQKQDEEQIQITEQSSQQLYFSNLVPEEKQQSHVNYNKMQRLIQIAKSKSQPKSRAIQQRQQVYYDEQEENRRISKNTRNKQKIKRQAEERQQRQRSRQKKKNIKKNSKVPKQIVLISDQDQEDSQNQKYEMIQFGQEVDKKYSHNTNKENQNLMQNLILQIDQKMEDDEMKLLPQKFKELQEELDLQKWEQYQFASGDFEMRKAQKDQQRRQKRKTQRLLQKRQKQAKIGKGKDRVSNSVFNGIEDYFT